MDKNIKELIEIPKDLDTAILKGFERGRSEKKSIKYRKIFKRSTVAAGLLVAGTALIGTVNPEIVSAIPIVGNVFEYFNDGIYKQSAAKYEELGQVVNTSVIDNDVKVTLNQVVVDDNLFIASMLIESDKFKGYDDTKNPQDFIWPDFRILIDGESPSSQWPNITMIDERTAAVVLECDISKIDLKDEVKVNLAINDISRGSKRLAKGEWGFDIKANKGTQSKIYNIGEKLKLNDTDVTFDKLVASDLVNRVYLTGKCSDYENFSINNTDFIIKDNTGKILTYGVSSGVSDSSGEFKYTLDILNDISNVKYIEVYRANGNTPVIKEINGFQYNVLKCSSKDELSTNRTNEVVSRVPSKEEKEDGYALDHVTYNVDIDKNTAFESVASLIGKEIAVNNTDKVIVKDIITKDDYTDVVMKVDGNYDYRLLKGIVLFDEAMNDSAAFEGSSITLNNIEEKLVTVRIRKIDPSKNYTIAVPITNDVAIDEAEKVSININ